MRKWILLLCTFPLSACVTMVGVPLNDALNLVVSGTSELMANSWSNTDKCTLRYPLHSICIEYNPNVAVPDFVPTMQTRLKQLQVDSTLYSPSAMPISCEATLQYTAARSWGSHFTSSDLQPYLGDAELTLLQGGRVLSLARYQTSRLGYEKWTSTATKMNQVVDDLVCAKPG
ncbi:MAG: hypothetical protein P4L87_22490 [Formivibrio sp.]|nr:hypothetical protein [Formivibrio sp.]